MAKDRAAPAAGGAGREQFGGPGPESGPSGAGAGETRRPRGPRGREGAEGCGRGARPVCPVPRLTVRSVSAAA